MRSPSCGGSVTHNAKSAPARTSVIAFARWLGVPKRVIRCRALICASTNRPTARFPRPSCANVRHRRSAHSLAAFGASFGRVMASTPACCNAASSAAGNAPSASKSPANRCIQGTSSATRAASSGRHGVAMSFMEIHRHCMQGRPHCLVRANAGRQRSAARQFGKPHAAAYQEGAGRFDTGPGPPEIQFGKHCSQDLRGDAEINGKLGWQRFFLPGLSNSAAKVVAPIGVNRGFSHVVGKLILPLNAAADGVGHTSGSTTVVGPTPTPRTTRCQRRSSPCSASRSTRRCGCSSAPTWRAEAFRRPSPSRATASPPSFGSGSRTCSRSGSTGSRSTTTCRSARSIRRASTSPSTSVARSPTSRSTSWSAR